MNKSQSRLLSALVLLVVCLFFIGEASFACFEDGNVFVGEISVADENMVASSGGQEGIFHGGVFTYAGAGTRSLSGLPGAGDLVIDHAAVRGVLAGASGAGNVRNMRGFFMSLLILYMLVNTLIILDKSCFYAKNQRFFFYVRYSLILLSVIHRSDGKCRQIQVMA